MSKLEDRLKYVRKMMGLSQAQLADMAGTSQQAIQQAEAGKAQNPRYLHKLAMEVGISFEWLAMNIMPYNQEETGAGVFSDKEVLGSFYNMPDKDQDLILQLMKSRGKPDSKKVDQKKTTSKNKKSKK